MLMFTMYVCSPRIAAQSIVKYINSNKTNQAMLALTVSLVAKKLLMRYDN